MKKIDTLNVKLLKPKKQTVDFLLSFSKSIEIMRGKSKSFVLSKN